MVGAIVYVQLCEIRRLYEVALKHCDVFVPQLLHQTQSDFTLLLIIHRCHTFFVLLLGFPLALTNGGFPLCILLFASLHISPNVDIR